ncbi:hypothetical protein Tsubulata_038961 [Turnera subulata]|uniref:Glycosyltransferase n=1 Tax=Turnera subulata TaxID=218843 RepID=A0A9Q0GFD8_9ROSI|nr:hypothetical protein Tsubulata_038961 [Turnera subulata]
MDNHSQSPHILMIAYPLQGHVIPFVHLATKLASKGFTITFVNTESIHHQITKSQLSSSSSSGVLLGPNNKVHDIFAEARKSGLDIRYATVSDGFPLTFDRSLHHDQFMEGILHVLSAHVDVLVGKLVSTNQPVTCLISDTFYVWSSMIANKYNLVNVSFWTEPALVFTLYYHMDLLRTNGHFASPHDDNREDAIDYIPGVARIDPKDMASYLQAADTTTVVHRIIYKAFEDVKRADFVICNTVQELEPKTISALQQKQPVYAVGPVLPAAGFTKSLVGTSLWPESDCTRWLNSKPHASVLYISFGSYAHCTKDEIVEIGHGVLLSGVSFIWVLRPDIVSSDQTDPLLPLGFEDEVKDRGMIVPWCSQIAVISHPALAGFLTHCGWNSILESVWCGIPLLCFPLLTDQFTNRKLVVDDWRIGLNLCDKKPITRHEVARNITRLISGESADELRKNVKAVKGLLENALSVAPGGSSHNNLNQFIDDMIMKANIKKKKK